MQELEICPVELHRNMQFANKQKFKTFWMRSTAHCQSSPYLSGRVSSPKTLTPRRLRRLCPHELNCYPAFMSALLEVERQSNHGTIVDKDTRTS